MSTSLNVVSIANVFCESFKRFAIRFLSLGIGTCRSRSFGGSCGSVGEVLGGRGILGGSAFGDFSSNFGFVSSAFGGVSFGVESSDGATCVSAGAADFDMIATLVPGVTVSPSLAMNLSIQTEQKVIE
ncbi:Os04g0394250 [Oryza sativa Japonica Group]|uniref:Os04g0394250 protein n=1 Tax=Oryza sativa subsp. japonica TaxID=39947 RepID=A0A0P0WA06_ORYSJ|nr:Os04g0394250 [Oryza sativa Japonica Group]